MTRYIQITLSIFILIFTVQCTKQKPDEAATSPASTPVAPAVTTSNDSLVAVANSEQPNPLKEALLDTQTHYVLDAVHSEVTFTVTKFNQPNRQGPQQIKGSFKNALSGTVNFTNPSESKISLNLETIETGNPLRNANILEAFFATRPSAIDAEAVNLVWNKIIPVLARGEKSALFQTQTLFVKQMENVVELEGVFIFWKRVKFFKSFRLVSFADQNLIRLKSDTPIELNLPKLVGEEIYGHLLEAFLAAKCPHVTPPFDETVQIFIDLALQKT